MPSTLDTAKLLLASGIAAIPVKSDKTPLLSSWRAYRTELPTDALLQRWFAKDAAIALVCGKVQCLDFDEKHSAGVFARFAKRAEEVGLDMLIGSLIQQSTPSGGIHLVWQCEPPVGNLKLANKATKETLIETRGDGGYFLIAPSDKYRLIFGDWSSIPEITPDDRDALLSLAKTFDETPVKEAHAEQSQTRTDMPNGGTPGDDFDFRADMPSLLKQYGWKPAGASDKYWTRPGKNKGISASWDVVPGRFFVFSSSTEFQAEHVYRPWHVFAILACSGDFSRAASELRRQGFGDPLPAQQKPASKPSKISDAELEALASTAVPPAAVQGADPIGAVPTNETREDKIRRLLKACRFNEDEVPPPIKTVFTLGGVVISTPGNLTAVTAQAKVGKSALIMALLAATMSDNPNCDFLTATGYNADGKAVLYIDTEQAKADFWWSVTRSKQRAKMERKPAWLEAHTVTAFEARFSREAIPVLMADAAERCAGIHSVFIDGVADLVLDVNDATECNAIVAELHGLAIRYDCPIVCVIHKNPGSDKTRGHLGSQIERKAETNLTMEKDDEITITFSEKQRRAPITKKTGPRFYWDKDLNMHATVFDDGKPKLTGKVLDLGNLAKTIFNGNETRKHKELVDAIMSDRNCSESTAKNRVIDLCKCGLIETNSFGHYVLKKPEISSV